MKGLVTVGLLAGLLAFAAPRPAQAGVHVSVGLPGFGAVVTTGPGYYGGYYPYPAYHYGPPVFVHGPAYYPRARYRSYGYSRPYYRPVRHHRYHRHCDH